MVVEMASTTSPAGVTGTAAGRASLVAGRAGHQTTSGASFDAQLVSQAPGRHYVFTPGELSSLGLRASSVRARAAAGRLHRIHRGVYAVIPPALLTVRGRYRAAVAACTGTRHTAALSHRSAADLHGLRECHRRTVEVIVPGRSTHRHQGIQVHRSVNLVESDTTLVEGIRVTTVARTSLDLAAVIPARGLERALDRAEQLRVFDLDALREQLSRNPRHPGAARLHATLSRYEVGTAVTDSELEEAFVAFCRGYDLAPPELHGAIDPEDGGVMLRPDAVWRDPRVVVEVDGERYHRTRRAFHEDRVRDQRLVAAGWRVIRTTWPQLTERPRELAAILRRLLG
jgi:hypothetical protein